jgi:hypothetical protein
MVNPIGNILGNTTSRVDPANKILGKGGLTPETIRKRVTVPQNWKLIDKKFGLGHFHAEHHRKVLQENVGSLVKKLLANFKLKEWHFYAKMR